LTPHQIQLVQESYKKIAPMADQVAHLFYGRLFETAPHVRPLFKGDMGEQGRKLMSMIGVAVAALDNLPELVPIVRDLGRRHASYGVKDDHYDVVAHALLWTMEKGLGESFTGDIKEAWTSAYMLLANTMKEAAQDVAA
jgi:hemoglobin-like flavoprotein